MNYNSQLYTYKVFWSKEDQEYVATCLEFPSLCWLSDTPLIALLGLIELVDECLLDIKQSCEFIPTPNFINHLNN